MLSVRAVYFPVQGGSVLSLDKLLWCDIRLMKATGSKFLYMVLFIMLLRWFPGNFESEDEIIL